MGTKLYEANDGHLREVSKGARNVLTGKWEWDFHTSEHSAACECYQGGFIGSNYPERRNEFGSLVYV